MGYTRGNSSDYALYQLAKKMKANSESPVYSRLCSSKCSNDGICMLDEKEIPKIVENIIHEKFKGTLSRIRQRSFERRMNRSKHFPKRYEEAIDSQNGSEDSGLNRSSSEDFSENKEDFSENKSAGRTQENIYEKIIVSQPSLGKIQSRNIRIPPRFKVDTKDLNSDHRANPQFSQSTDNSVGSSNISSLISSRFCPSYKHSCDIKADPLSIKSQQITESVDTESVILEKMENLNQEINFQIVSQLEIIFQISKALNTMFRLVNPNRDVVLEAEKILLLATVKKETFEKYILEVTPDRIQETEFSTTINMKSVCFNLDTKFEQINSRKTWHFVCIVSIGCLVLSSDIIIDEENGILKCEKDFNFDKITDDFDMNVAIYALAEKKRKKSCFDICRKIKRRIKTQNVIREPSFRLWGKTTIKIFRLKQKYFKLTYISDDATILHHFLAETQISHNINIELRGFLTIGKLYKELPRWNTRWCTLKSFHFKYWNSPNEELVSECMGNLDLRRCTKVEIRKEPSICPKPRYLYLEIYSNAADTTVTKYYFFANNEEDLDQWYRNLHKVYDILDKKGFFF